MKVGEFFVDLGITSSGAATLKDFIGAMGNLKLRSIGAVGALGSVATYFGGVIDSASGAAVAFQKFQNQTGLAASELQRWQIVAKQANISAEDIASSVFNLQNNLAGIRLGQGNISPFQILGVSPLGDAFQVLKELRSAKGRFSPDQFTRQITAMGLSPSMMNVLGLSDARFNEFLGTAQGISPEARTNVLELTESLNKLWLKIKDVNYEVANMASGPLNSIVKEILARWDTSTPAMAAGTAVKSGGDFLTYPFRQLNHLVSAVAADMSGAPAGRLQTNNLSVSVTGGASDRDFAEQVALKVVENLATMVSHAEAQTPVPESRPK